MAYAWGTSANSANNASGTSLTLSATYAVHDRVQVWQTYGSGTRIVESCSDGTNTYAYVTTLSDSTNGQSWALFECLDAAAGTFTITFGLASGAGARGVAAFHQSGLANSGSLQSSKQVQAAPGTGTDALTSTNLTPASQPGMLLGLAMDDSTAGTITAGTGFTNEGAQTNWDGAFATTSRAEDKRLTATTAVAATFTVGTGADRYAAWAIFIPEAGGATTVAPGVGNITFTGYAPTVVQNTNVAPGLGNLTITGYAPTVVQNTAVAPAAGTLAITGYAPTVLQNTAVAPAAGVLTITGYAPTVTQQINTAVNPDVGALAITGYAPTVAQTANQAVAPSVGALTITGYAPTVAQTGIVLDQPSGGFVDYGTAKERRRLAEKAHRRVEEGMGAAAPLPMPQDEPDQQRIRRKTITRADLLRAPALPNPDVSLDVAFIAARQRRQRDEEELLLFS